MANFIKIEVLSGQDVILNKKQIVSICRVLSDHTGGITEFSEVRLRNGSKWHTNLTIDFLHKALNQ